MADAARALGRGSLSNKFGATGIDFANPENDAAVDKDNMYATTSAAEKRVIETNLGQQAEDNPDLLSKLGHLAIAQKNIGKDGSRHNAVDDYIMHTLREQTIRALQQLIDAKNVELAQVRTDITGHEQALAKYDRYDAAYDRMVKSVQDNEGKIQLNQDGTLADEDAEAMLSELESRTGQRIDRRNSESVLRALKEQKEFQDRERIRLEDELKRLRDREKTLKTEIDDLEKDKREVEAGRKEFKDLDKSTQIEIQSRGLATPEMSSQIDQAEQAKLTEARTRIAAQFEEDDGLGSPKPAFNKMAQATKEVEPVTPVVNVEKEGPKNTSSGFNA